MPTSTANIGNPSLEHETAKLSLELGDKRNCVVMVLDKPLSQRELEQAASMLFDWQQQIADR